MTANEIYERADLLADAAAAAGAHDLQLRALDLSADADDSEGQLLLPLPELAQMLKELEREGHALGLAS